MPKVKPPLPWECSTKSAYVPLSFEGEVVGFCRPDCATEIAKSLNEAEVLQKALQLACYELVARSGGSSESVGELVKRYLAKAERPLQGSALIAVLLKERQIDLDLTDDEFAKFCDSYRLSRAELREIYGGEEIESHQLIPLSRILGKTVDDIIEAWKGDD
ncbi:MULTISPECIES: hypothetical protein [Leptolyngbya]|uniref:hypothetical protein n=1 Tax=Leptolyngbya TaxID=47251 RepID=UPI001688BA14|nr:MULTISPECIES: hypothetical protein [unclassified Leptolyngbya]MBD1856908.1 hypothetical protein [Leptolyngbya sp. FACHB-1624]MBN8561512.1 hypothetical protein [Leptolyngbya sp. UWPOB_LEPTO1]MCY6492754.1 hypothetical protein [Leptolyngbya sp. GGD]